MSAFTGQVRNWVVTYAGNLIGSLVFVWAFQYTGLLTGTTAAMVRRQHTAPTHSACATRLQHTAPPTATHALCNALCNASTGRQGRGGQVQGRHGPHYHEGHPRQLAGPHCIAHHIVHHTVHYIVHYMHYEHYIVPGQLVSLPGGKWNPQRHELIATLSCKAPDRPYPSTRPLTSS